MKRHERDMATTLAYVAFATASAAGGIIGFELGDLMMDSSNASQNLECVVRATSTVVGATGSFFLAGPYLGRLGFRVYEKYFYDKEKN